MVGNLEVNSNRLFPLGTACTPCTMVRLSTYSMNKTCSGLNPCYFFCFGLPLLLFCSNISAYTYALQLIYQLLCETVIDQTSTSFHIPGRINNVLLLLIYACVMMLVIYLFCDCLLTCLSPSHKFEFFKGHVICFCICNNYHVA